MPPLLQLAPKGEQAKPGHGLKDHPTDSSAQQESLRPWPCSDAAEMQEMFLMSHLLPSSLCQVQTKRKEQLKDQLRTAGKTLRFYNKK